MLKNERCAKGTDWVYQKLVKRNYINLLAIDPNRDRCCRWLIRSAKWQLLKIEEKDSSKKKKKKRLKYVIVSGTEEARHGIHRGKYLAAKPQFAVNYAAKTWKTIDATSRFKSVRGIARPSQFLAYSLDDFREESERAEHSKLGVHHCKNIRRVFYIHLAFFPTPLLRSIRRREHTRYLMNELKRTRLQ